MPFDIAMRSHWRFQLVLGGLALSGCQMVDDSVDSLRDGGSDVDVSEQLDAGPRPDASPCGGCGGGRYCDEETGECKSCSTDERCGFYCETCGGTTPACTVSFYLNNEPIYHCACESSTQCPLEAPCCTAFIFDGTCEEIDLTHPSYCAP